MNCFRKFVTPIPLITGLGLATPLGGTLASTWNALCAGQAICDHARVPDLPATGEPRVTVLARRVAAEAIAAARWDLQQTQSSSLIVGTSKGPIDAWIESLSTREVPPQTDDTFGLSEISASVAATFSIGGQRLTLSAACASGLHALIRGAMMIRSGETQRAIVVAAESSLHPLFLASFDRLGVIAPKGHGCRPFDRSRAGFVISEAAAAICLEASTITPHDAVPIAAIDRFAMGADATHLTAGDSQGHTLRRILASVVDGQRVDLVHAHGTGTIAHDPIELAAIQSVRPEFDAQRPILYSHKGALGHSLGAAGLVAAVINCLAHRDGMIPPNIHTRDPLPLARLHLDAEMRRQSVQRSIAVAAGFGGAIAAVSFWAV